MITSPSPPWSRKPLLSILLLLIAVTLTDSKKTFELRRWESTGIVNCTTAQNEFTCADSKNKVLPIYQRCDGISHCKDKSDERNCTECRTPFSVKREDGTLECINAQELTKERANRQERERIDGYPAWIRAAYHPNHKKTTEDSMYPKCTASERKKLWRNWTSSCAEGEKRCKHEPMCVPAGSVCDGIVDCSEVKKYPWSLHRSSGADDEESCQECTGGALKCDDKCVPSASLCDGKRDCGDGSDEKNCTCATCRGPGLALCLNGQCIASHRVCDGLRDCEDTSDEQNCPAACGAVVTKETVLPPIITHWSGRYLKSELSTGACPICPSTREQCDCKTAFYCSSGNKCISKDMVCDGERDCWDGADEKHCLKACAKYPHFSA